MDLDKPSHSVASDQRLQDLLLQEVTKWTLKFYDKYDKERCPNI